MSLPVPSPARPPLPLPASPADSGFLPRREFSGKSRPTNTFGLLTVANTSSLRLAAFPTPVIDIFRKYLDERKLIRQFHEVTEEHHVAEFTLNAKFWANPKALETEKLLLDIIILLNRAGWAFLSSIDYGREPGDKLTLAFSRPLKQETTVQQLVFALSFPSTVSLRVINPPLESTPGILQAVRGGWRRGIDSETKLSNGCWEFKLKGYSFFAEDTFQADALHHTLALLNSFDKNDYSLLTTLSLSNNRSRTQDLWIFTCPITDSASPSGTLSHSPVAYTSGAASRQGSNDKTNPESGKGSLGLHQRGLSGPSMGFGGHSRSTSVDQAATQARGPSTIPLSLPLSPSKLAAPKPQPTLLKKSPTPRQSPKPAVVALPRASMDTSQRPITPQTSAMQSHARAHSTSSTPSPPPQVLYATPPSYAPISASATPPRDSPETTLYGSTHFAVHPPSTHSPDVETLLSPGAFRETTHSSGQSTVVRDSAMSVGSVDVPVVWTGGGNLPEVIEDANEQTSSPTLMVPGGWLDEPATESPPARSDEHIRSLDAMVEGPHLVRVAEPEEGQEDPRRSEAVVFQTLPDATESKDTLVRHAEPEAKQSNATLTPQPASQKEGWVLVNVSGNGAQPADGQTSDAPAEGTPKAPHEAPTTTDTPAAGDSDLRPAVERKPTQPETKAAKVKGESLHSREKSASGFRRLFSKESKGSDIEVAPEGTKTKSPEPEKGGITQRWRKGSTLSPARASRKMTLE